MQIEKTFNKALGTKKKNWYEDVQKPACFRHSTVHKASRNVGAVM